MNETEQIDATQKKAAGEQSQDSAPSIAEAYRIFLRLAPHRTILAMRWLLALTLLAVSAELLFRFVFSDPEQRTYTDKEIVSEVRSAAQLLAERVTHLRDRIAQNDTIRQRTVWGRDDVLFHKVFEIKQHHDDSLASAAEQEGAFSPSEQYSVAIYDPARKLLAWSSTTPLRSPWDTTLANTQYIEHKSRAIFVERHGEYIWLTALRRISDTASSGFVVSRALLSYAANERQRNIYSHDFLTPVAEKVEHVLDIDYLAKVAPSDINKEPYGIVAEQGEPATFIGRLRIGEATAHEATGVAGVLISLRDLLSAVLLFFIVGGIVYVLLKRPDLKEHSRIRFQTSMVVVSLFVGARAILMLLGNFQSLLPARAYDTDHFAIADLAGIAGNPVELLLSALTVAIIATLIARIVTISSGTRHLTIPFWKFILCFLSFIGGQILLLHLLKLVLEGIITNSTISFYPIKEAIPHLPELFIYFAIVLIGFIYCIIATTLMIWFLTVSLPLLRLENYEVLIGRGIALVVVLLMFMTAAVLLLAPEETGPILTKYYWFFVAIPVVTIAALVWLSQLKTAANDPLTRFSITSGLAILVLVSAGSIVVTPLVSSLEFGNKVAILKVSSRTSEDRVIEYAARLEAAFMEFDPTLPAEKARTAERFFNDHLRIERAAARVTVMKGRSPISQYGDRSLLHDSLLSAYAASLYRLAAGSKSPYLIRVDSGNLAQPSRTYSNIIIGVLRLDTSKDSDTYLIAAIDPSSQKTPYAYTDQAGKENAITALYQNNTLRSTSTPSLNMPSHLPADLYRKVLSTGAPANIELTIDGERYFFAVHQTHPQVMAVTGHQIPNIGAIFEIALHIHFLGILLAIIFSILNFFIRAFFASEQLVLIRFRERILLIVIALAFIPLILVTNVTRSLLGEREIAQKREHLISDAGAAASRLQKAGRQDSVSADRILHESATTLRRSIQLYDSRGILYLADDENLVESGMLNRGLDVEAVRDIFIGGKSFTLKDIPVGSATVIRSAFQVLPSVNGQSANVLAVREIDAALRIEESIASTISFIYGVFAAVAVLLLLVGALFAYLLSRPISKVIKATEEVAGGAYDVVVPIDRKDEMGDLANAFNRMSFELDRSRERLAQSEREVAWKEMARQVAHEIKNPLTPMKLSVQHVEHAFETKDENFSAIFRRVMRTLSEQIAVLTRIATEFSRFGEMPRRRYTFVSFKKVTESAVALFDAERSRIRFVIDVPENLSAIYADEEEFRRTLVNLIRNAVQAIDKWGVIIISARELHGLIHIKITDTGAGISKETQAKIFNPNFSTKTSGMGLGLAIVKRSITDMSGQIYVESEVGKGTTFHIDLPAREFPTS